MRKIRLNNVEMIDHFISFYIKFVDWTQTLQQPAKQVCIKVIEAVNWNAYFQLS